MPRIRQQYWFCLAAICIVGSLMTLWSSDIPVAEEASQQLTNSRQGSVLRRLSELPAAAQPPGQSSPTPWQDPLSGSTATPEFQIQAPAGVAGRSATILNTTSRVIPRQRITPAGYQEPFSSPLPEAVRFSGQIEPLDSTP